MHNKRRIRILQIIETLGLGGSERLLATNMKFIDKDGFENIVVSLYSDRNSQIIYDALKDIKVEKIYPRFRHDLFTISRAIFKCIKKYKIDIIHTHAPISDIYGRIIGRLTGCPVINTIHGIPYEITVALGRFKRLCLKIKLFLIRCIDRWTIKLCVERLIAVSEFVKEYMMRYSGTKAERMSVLYNSVDIDYFKDIDPAAVLARRRELGIENDQKILLTVGRNIAEKGQRYALEATRSLVSKKYKVKLIIVGAGPLRNELEAYSTKLQLKDYVIFLDPQEDIRSLLQMCDVFIFTSLYEGLGIAQIEAMAMRKPIIAFKIGPTPEVVNNGINGILVNSRDPKKLSESIEVLLNNPESGKDMGLEGRRIVEKRFDIRKNVKFLENIYLEIFNNKNG